MFTVNYKFLCFVFYVVYGVKICVGMFAPTTSTRECPR